MIWLIHFCILLQSSLSQAVSDDLIGMIRRKNETALEDFISSSFTALARNMNATIDMLLNKGQFKALEHFLGIAKREHLGYKEALAVKVKEKREELDRVYQELIKLHSPNFLLVAPAFFWYEDDYHVTLEIMFSHRHTAPGCIDIEDYKIMLFENNQTFHFNANCLMGDDEYFFELEFNFFEKVNKIEKQDITRGQVKVRLEKSQKKEWGALVPAGEEPPSNMIKKY